MKRLNLDSTELQVSTESRDDRRHEPRLAGQFNLMFSGVGSAQMMIGDGAVTNLSRKGIGVCGNRLVEPGMHLALFIELPDLEEHLCIPQAHVSWVEGRRFGVQFEFQALKLEDQNRLRYFLWEHQQRRPV